MNASVNVGEGERATLLGPKKVVIPDDWWDEEIAPPERLSQNHVHQVHHVHPDEVDPGPDPANDDPFIMAEDPATADLSAALAALAVVTPAADMAKIQARTEAACRFVGGHSHV